MKKIGIIITVVFLIFSCTFETKDSISEDLSSDDFLIALEPYLIEDVSLISRDVPALGVPTAVEALQDITNDILASPSTNPFYSESELQQSFDEDFLDELKIGSPILIHNFLEMDDYRENYVYLFYAVHPTYGIVATMYYEYFDRIDSYGLATITYSIGQVDSIGPQIVSQPQARSYAEMSLGIVLEKDPIAVSLPDPDLNFYYMGEDLTL